MVRFQRMALSNVSPSTQHPPGKRTNDGCRFSSIVARSRRMPLGRPLKVFCGKSETMSIHSVPGFQEPITSRALGSVALDVRVSL